MFQRLGVPALVATILAALLALPASMVREAVIGWINDRVASFLGLSSPSVEVVIAFCWNFGIPVGVAIGVLFAYHKWHARTLRRVADSAATDSLEQIFAVTRMNAIPIALIVMGLATVAIGLLLWRSYPAASGRITGDAGYLASPPEPAVNASQEQKWGVTQPYDVPHKLAAIDAALALLGTPIDDIGRRCNALAGNWRNAFGDSGDLTGLERNLREISHDATNVVQGIAKIDRDNEKYDDIFQILLNRNQNTLFFSSLGEMLSVIVALKGNFAVDFNTIVGPKADKFFDDGLKALGRWRAETTEALVKRRKEIAG
jgi:hypothetical protein